MLDKVLLIPVGNLPNRRPVVDEHPGPPKVLVARSTITKKSTDHSTCRISMVRVVKRGDSPKHNRIVLGLVARFHEPEEQVTLPFRNV